MHYTYDRNKYQYRPVQRRKLFTGNQDADRNILFNISDDEILYDTCKLNKYAKSLCDDNFWSIKINQLLPGLEFPAEFKNKGQLLHNTIRRGAYFVKEDEYVLNINNIADWALLNGYFDLMISLFKINLYPKEYEWHVLAVGGYYEPIKRFVDYVTANNKFEKLLVFRRSFPQIILKNYNDILKLLLPYNILRLEEIYDIIFREKNANALNLILDYMELTQEQVNDAFIDDDSFRFRFSETLINKDYYPDNEILKELSEKQKIALQKFLDNKNNGNYQPKLY